MGMELGVMVKVGMGKQVGRGQELEPKQNIPKSVEKSPKGPTKLLKTSFLLNRFG